MRRLRRMFIILIPLLIVVALGVIVAYLARPAPAVNQHYGISFTSSQATELGLDPKATYQALLDDVGVKQVRLGAYWNVIEPKLDQYDFSELDWQIDEAARHHATVLLGIGRKLPRWPECFEPTWTDGLAGTDYESAFLSMMKTVVTRYRDRPELTAWQLENEPFVWWFGKCPRPNKALLERELGVVKSLSNKPVVVTDSGELSLWWPAVRFGDIFGTTMYRITWNPWFGYGPLLMPSWAYRAKARLYGLTPSHMLITELQAEPWSPGILLVDTPIPEQMKTMDIDRFTKNIAYAKASGLGDVYLWGAEWWYWMKEKGHPEFWDAAKKLFAQ